MVAAPWTQPVSWRRGEGRGGEGKGGEGKGGVEFAEVTNCPTYYFHAGRCYQNSSFKQQTE